MHSMQEQSAAMRCRHDLAVQPPPRALPANAPPVVLRVACRHLSRCNAHHHHHQAAAAAAATGTAAARHARSAAAHAYQPLAVGAAHQPRVRPVTPAPQRLDPATGFVANTASRAKVPPAWDALLAGITAAYHAACGDSRLQLLGVYLRGSLPQGHFLAGVSDVDTFACVLPPPARHEPAACQGAADVQQLQQAVVQQLQPLLQQHSQLGFTKVETKLLQVQPGSTAAHMLAELLQAGAGAHDHPQQQSLRQLPPSVCADIPAAFELKTASVVLAGVNLPLLLPACAALPPAHQLLPGLADGVAAARQAAAAADAELAPQVAATRWSLKRLIRAAFELVQPHASVWTGDLYWCCELAKQHHPQLLHQLRVSWPPTNSSTPQQQQQQQQQQWEQQLDQALSLYVDLQLSAAEWQQQLREPPGQHIQASIQASWALIDTLLPRLETLFLKLMVTEEPGWLTLHQSGKRSSSSSSGGGGRHQPAQPQESGRGKGLLQELLRPWQAAAAAGPAGQQQQQQAPGAGVLLPAVQVPVWGPVQSFDWSQQQEQAAGAAAARALLLQSRLHWSHNAQQQQQQSAVVADSGPQQQQQQQQQELWGCWPQPLVLRGAAADWPCVSEPWDLAWLQRQSFQGRVRVAPSLQFPFVEPQLLDVLLKLRGPGAAPSLVVEMPAAEFAQRLTQGGQPIAFSPAEHYYLQAALPQQLQHEAQMAGLLARMAASLQEQQQLRLSQEPRLWVSPAGAVSPLHYDASHSFLVQAVGCKRMLLFAPDQLHRLYCYPDTHLLRRRSRVNLAAPDLARFPLFGGVGALEVVLQPGDVLAFPRLWAHHTESGVGGDVDGGCSVSMTFRVTSA